GLRRPPPRSLQANVLIVVLGNRTLRPGVDKLSHVVRESKVDGDFILSLGASKRHNCRPLLAGQNRLRLTGGVVDATVITGVEETALIETLRSEAVQRTTGTPLLDLDGTVEVADRAEHLLHRRPREVEHGHAWVPGVHEVRRTEVDLLQGHRLAVDVERRDRTEWPVRRREARPVGRNATRGQQA